MKTFIFLASTALLAAAAPAIAKPGKGHGNPHSITSRSYHDSQYGYGNGGCPPGLAKKNPSCVPPGQAKKQFAQGQRLPYGYRGFTDYDDLPYDLRQRYRLDEDDRYIYGEDYLYQVDPQTMIVERILRSIL